MSKHVVAMLVGLVFLFSAPLAEAQPTRVLWWNGTRDEPPNMYARDRQTMADYIGAYQGGQVFDVTMRSSLRGGDLAQALSSAPFDIVILDVVTRRRYMNAQDLTALKNFYASGKTGLMLDGSIWIRNFKKFPVTTFPGENGSVAGLLINQMFVLAEAGGGIFIGADHDTYQVGANQALQALVPGAKFSGSTNPSSDGQFIGNALLGKRVPITARDILRHWEAVPNQGEAPVGEFTDFLGHPVTLYSLVETADKPGGGRKRPYISASVFPGAGQTDIDSDEPVFDNLPTHKSGG
ncbi:MAG: hypothetical protein OIF48_13100 [Silicimonas sp.]|nr:hypothetical protein [Silicimonas sp.]